MIVHGAGATKEYGRVLGSLPDVPKDPGQVVFTRDAERTIFVIPSLAPPEWNKWHKWAEPYQAKMQRRLQKELATPNDAPEIWMPKETLEVKKYDAALRTLRGKRFISVEQTGKSERWLLNLRVNEAFELAQDLLTMVDWYHKVTIGCLKDNRESKAA